ncbi:MAG: hypothetical protein HKN14_02095 [Marinicaulis sp.]|nr:hypothetical protein [Marinicaulis sp.]NNL90438.1 hypothetical protein [Marinicaulis sp.]
MRNIGKIMTAATVLAALGACTTYERPFGTGESISIPYDPYNYDPDDLEAEAQAHCGAYGMRAVYDDETIDPQSVRWRYRHYRCV